MLKLLEEGFNLGLGVASVAANRIEGLVKETLDKVGVKEGEDKKDLKERLVNEGISAREKINDCLKKQAGKLEKLDPATPKLDLILAKLEKIEAEIAKLKK
ncbi:MAG: hypothetical protein II943_07185 [Victivallales bacterium]|nr:hypothetical protein [Victivallales bacterium]